MCAGNPGRRACWLGLFLVLGCAGHVSRAESTAVSIRFAIAAKAGVAGPLYVLLNREDGQLGWLTVTRDGERIYLSERCELPDCGAPVAVCGAAIPIVRDIAAAGSPGQVEFVWDGMTSASDTLARCERRERAAQGSYVARFCFSHEATFEGAGGAAQGAFGRLLHPDCVERPFTLLTPQVVLTM